MAETVGEKYLFQNPEIACDLLRQLNSLRQASLLTDVIICTDSCAFPCHRNVLASSSPYFKAMFCNNFRESSEERVTLNGVDPETLRQIILYVYTGEILITQENVFHLIEAASMFQYEKILQACSKFLQDQLTPQNCLSVIRLSEFFSCENLKKNARDMAFRCFSEVSISEDLKELYAQELLDYLGDDDLCGEEEQVFEALMTWVRHDLQRRKSYMADLFRKVRLQYVHPTFLFHFIANDPLIQSSSVCRSTLESACKVLFSCHSSVVPDVKPLWHVPRRFSHQEFLINVGGRKDSQQTTRDVLLYSEKTNQWLRLAKLPLRLYKASSVGMHGNVYVLDGLSTYNKTSTVVSSVYILSLKLNQWRKGEPMLVPRYSHRSISFKNYIFSIGGIGEKQEILSSMERFDSIYNVWEVMANMPVAVLHPAVAAKDERIYLFGGEDVMQNPVRLIQVYNISRNMWFRMETRMVKNVCAPAVVIGEKIIIIGGYTRRIIAYDMKQNKFMKCADMKDRRMHHGATVLQNKLYVTGGRYLTADNTIEDSDSFDCYDPETDTWTSKGKLPSRLFDHGCLTLHCSPSNLH
ncbi:kelch-like protein 38 [Spea bombifrons]|uniref:kelch-like protein 38 n=1 Tax=Spea bombifrons TaxID=233779 RepID=UPI00234B2B1F|nr:kelch-like protein 38 [Spea bombifrons]XP_053323394.1 kelch-like protein 38 [Spea bombifrons]